jgi:hypothetical protein
MQAQPSTGLSGRVPKATSATPQIVAAMFDSVTEWVPVEGDLFKKLFKVPVLISRAAIDRCLSGGTPQHQVTVNEVERSKRYECLVSTLALTAKINFPGIGQQAAQCQCEYSYCPSKRKRSAVALAYSVWLRIGVFSLADQRRCLKVALESEVPIHSLAPLIRGARDYVFSNALPGSDYELAMELYQFLDSLGAEHRPDDPWMQSVLNVLNRVRPTELLRKDIQSLGQRSIYDDTDEDVSAGQRRRSSLLQVTGSLFRWIDFIGQCSTDANPPVHWLESRRAFWQRMEDAAKEVCHA